MILRKTITLATAIALAGVAANAATAHGEEEHAKRFAESQYRHDNMEMAKDALVNILQHFKGQADHEGHLAKLAQMMALSASMAKDSFAKDTRGTEGFTEAKPEIWDNWADYAARMDTYADDAWAFADAAASGGDIQGTFKKAVSNCKSCHDKYRD